ncbi:monovalent cation:proton antiporter-2 (CPA2) family protein [Plasticicumulans sp.]|uniref:monovalent cation:proton antiporter-2 (CPA2) family protein n=3 Tax=Plasticicumulans sp. TaxID=2307179 RepID=UPI00321F6377
MSDLAKIVVILAAAVLAVPLAKRLGLGAVIGYLLAGVLIGPWGLALIREHEEILHVGELGVVLLLFIVGLELQPSRLWALRRPVFGLGGLQVLLTGGAVMAVMQWLGWHPGTAFVIGFGLSLSSTAFVLQLLGERGELTARHGRDAFAVLLMQDVAVIPMLAILPLFAPSERFEPGEDLQKALVAGLAIAGVVLAGRYLLPRLFRLVAAAHSHEIATAAALLVVAATALGFTHIGLSMSLGAFLVGMLLSDSEFRHELEANIEPFKGLLLGLFFVAVGLSANLGLLTKEPGVLLALTAALIAVKALLLFLIARLFGTAPRPACKVAVLLAQGGEFAFVLFAVARDLALLTTRQQDELNLAVTLSMAASPMLVRLTDSLAERLAERRRRRSPAQAEPIAAAPVLIAGYGPFGQTVARYLRVHGIPCTVLETDLKRIELGRALGQTVHFGDASRIELLRAASAGDAHVLVIAVDDGETSLRIARTVRHHFPRLRTISRACDVRHTLALMELGVGVVTSDTYLSALEMSEHVAVALGVPAGQAHTDVLHFRAHDQRNLDRLRAVHHDEARMLDTARAIIAEMEEVFRERRHTPATQPPAAGAPPLPRIAPREAPQGGGTG